MDTCPDKISVAVFLAALMPDCVHEPSYVLDQLDKWTPAGASLDTELFSFGDPQQPSTAFLFGPKFVSNLYNLCSDEDVALGMMLRRPSCRFAEDLSKKSPFSKERFGSVKRVYIVCTHDKGMNVNFQR
ncbi:hypothetical protein CASFOL_039867 [Castilleja foliolosa]|uniref:Uncharacterized protein n=1 Tax=Castilleja foliolosa TaxID=1961234 RepID=A0ABD3BGT8_9LAMI